MEAKVTIRVGKTALKLLRYISENPLCTTRQALAPLRPSHCARSWGNSYFLPADSDANGFASSLRRRGMIVKSKYTLDESTRSAWVLTHFGELVLKSLVSEITDLQECNPCKSEV